MAKTCQAVAHMNENSNRCYALTKQLVEEQKYQLGLKAQLSSLNAKVRSLNKSEE